MLGLTILLKFGIKVNVSIRLREIAIDIHMRIQYIGATIY